MDAFKEIINFLCSPKILFTGMIVVFFFVFPINNWFEKWNERLKIKGLWTIQGLYAILGFLLIFFLFGISDPNFRLIVFKPDNVPIVGLIFLVVYFLWLAMHQATNNDKRLALGEKPEEFGTPDSKVLVFPDLVYIEVTAMLLCTALLFFWSIGLDAPIEEPANPAVSPNPSKAPWYFLGLQEMLVYFDPWIAGVVLPSVMILGMMAIPYMDTNTKASGYYSFKERRMAVSMFLFGWIVLWIFLILVGTFLRGPNWNFFGLFEFWDIHKLEPLNNVNLSEYIYLIWFKTGLPQNILIREMWGFILVGGYLFVLPPLFAKTVLKGLFEKLGPIRYSFFISLTLMGVALPIKMYLRWAFNLKYIVGIPEFFFNI